ncbi:indole-diterpene biosynthesis protein-like protein PaxU [Phaeosphaeriaceae sp. PMI808]|nr:indole-diterpene biosynthesis protein-like protein PaxU [Phaeosphaeriaceae sp. PMI808]
MLTVQQFTIEQNFYKVLDTAFDNFMDQTLTMSLPKTTPDGTITKPLSEFQIVGHNTYLWTSPSYLSKSAKSAPLILIFGWNAAAAKHIAKYAISYQNLFPTSRIVLVRCFTRDMFRRTVEYGPLLKPAMDLVNEHISRGGELLVHSFSNGGGNQVNEFAKKWKVQYKTLLPMRIQVLDSSPTKGPWMKSHAAITASLPHSLFWRWFGGTFVHLLLACTFIVWTALRKENKMVILCRQLNDETVFDNNVPRVYLYSRADQMVGFEEADEHANISESKGWNVTRVHFEQSAHCGHVREDEKKYWASIIEAWKRGPGDV